MTEVVPLFTQFGPGVAVLALLIVLLVKLRDRVGGRIDDSVEGMFDRLESEIADLRRELREERESARRYRAARETVDVAHRRWDAELLRIAATGGDVSKLPDPPPLTPHPTMYHLNEEPAQ